MFGLFGDIPVQMCQFHQIQIVQRYLTRKPKSEAAIELKKLTLKLTKLKKNQFVNNLDNWHLRWSDYLNERSQSPSTGKTYYTHKRLRSAYLSLKRHLSYSTMVLMFHLKTSIRFYANLETFFISLSYTSTLLNSTIWLLFDK